MNLKRRVMKLEQHSGAVRPGPFALILSENRVWFDGEWMTLEEYRAIERPPLLHGQFRGVDFRANKADFRPHEEEN